MSKYNFQYCQKIVVYSKDFQSILLCKRKSEEDYNGVYSFIGGKLETTDKDIIAGLKREKDEELGANFKINLLPTFTTNVHFVKADGNSMILPHYYAVHDSGEIDLGEEYSDYKWVKIKELESFEPKIPNITEITNKLLSLPKIDREYILI